MLLSLKMVDRTIMPTSVQKTAATSVQKTGGRIALSCGNKQGRFFYPTRRDERRHESDHTEDRDFPVHSRGARRAKLQRSRTWSQMLPKRLRSRKTVCGPAQARRRQPAAISILLVTLPYLVRVFQV